MASRAASGVVRLLATEPSEEERYAHAAGLLAIVARTEAAKREQLKPNGDSVGRSRRIGRLTRQ
jgi:hypothetical protein